ncbi:MAG: hypothetical protein ACKVS6_16510 [Planctomycetota bacterium]
MERTTLFLAFLLLSLLPSCAIGRGPIQGVRISLAFEERLTGTETHEPDLHRATREAALAHRPSAQLLRDEAEFHKTSGTSLSNSSFLALVAPSTR